MPEPEEVQSAETLVTDESHTEGQETAAEGGTEPQPKLIFDKFKDVDEAGKAYKESVRKITEQGQLLAEREKQLKDLEEKAKLADVLKSLAESRKPEPQSGGEDYQKFLDSLSAEMTEAPAEATKKLVHLANSWVAESEKKGKSYSDERAAKLESQLSELRDMMERMDPSYQQNKDVIDELVSGGMKLGAAKKFVAKLVNDNPDSVRRTAPPTSPDSGRTVRTSTEPVFITAKDKARLKAEGADDAMIADLEAEYKRNWLKEQAEAKRIKEG